MRDYDTPVKGTKIRVQLLENGRVSVIDFTAPDPAASSRVLTREALPQALAEPLHLLQLVDPDTQVPGLGYKYDNTIFYIEKHDENTK